jgi:hypothetical protein
MSAVAKHAAPAAPTDARPDEVLIHVRFYPNGEISTIDACPDQLSSRAWFERLGSAATRHYQTLAGGRGFFRIPRSTFDSIPKDGVQ